MATKLPSVAVGVFDTREQAEAAIADLRATGFDDKQFGIGARRPGTEATEASGPPTWESGAAFGGLTGAALGGLAAGPPGMFTGALAGLLVGSLIDLGVPEQDARWYSTEAESGRIVITVRTDGRYAEAHEIILRHGGRESRSAT